VLLDERSRESECQSKREKLTMVNLGYPLIVPVIFWYLLIRVWIESGRRIPFIFIGLWIVAVFGLPYFHLPSLALRLTEIALSISLVLIDRYQTGYRKGYRTGL
jgi:hypothetical protein